MRRALITLAAAALALALLPDVAAAKGEPGERMIELSAAPPRDLSAGEPWRVAVSILDHRGKPVDGPPPKLGAMHLGSGEKRDFQPHATGTDGVWRFTVQFPSPGPWQYELEDGLGQNHKLGPLVVAAGPAGAPPGDGGGSSSTGWFVAGIAALAGALFLLARRARGGAAAPPPHASVDQR